MSNANFLPDYHERDFEYDSPDYLASASQSINVKLYRDWRTLWALRQFHEACEDYDWRQPKEVYNWRHPTGIYVHVSKYPYHPEFAEAFATRIGGIHEDGSRLALADIEYFLEKEYGGELERPDCDYLSDILEDNRDIAQFPKNIERALQWLTIRKEQLPPWPNWNTKDSCATASITEKNIEIHKLADEKLASGQNHSDIPHTSDNNPFDDILSKEFPVELLIQLLQNLHFINFDNGKASNEAKAGDLRAVIFALRDKKCFIRRASAASISAAFRQEFNAQVSDSYIGKERSNSRSLLKSSWQKETYDNSVKNIEDIIGKRQAQD